jgi:lysophospholipase L1-like esterase
VFFQADLAPYEGILKSIVKTGLTAGVLGASLRQERRVSVLAFCIAVILIYLSLRYEGVGFVFLASVGCTLGFIAVLLVLRSFSPRPVHAIVSRIIPSVALTLGSLAIGLTLAELGLAVLEMASPNRLMISDEALLELPAQVREKVFSRNQLMKMPSSMRRRKTKMPGASQAFYWQGALHVFDQNGMRLTNPIPQKDPNKFRIMIVGDSFTYGFGVDQKYIYPQLLADRLSKNYAVEVINLGVPGYQSHDILKIIDRFYDKVKPDLVIYGVCLNDFLESGEQQYFSIRLPELLVTRTRIGNLLEEGINTVSDLIGFSPDFYGQIIRNMTKYEPRFARDLRQMNEIVINKGGPPIVAMVLDELPSDSRGNVLALTAERAARSAGMNVIPSSSYLKRYEGRTLTVSRWEDHPNEWAHSIFAEMLYNGVVGCCGMRRYPALASSKIAE